MKPITHDSAGNPVGPAVRQVRNYSTDALRKGIQVPRDKHRGTGTVAPSGPAVDAFINAVLSPSYDTIATETELQCQKFFNSALPHIVNVVATTRSQIVSVKRAYRSVIASAQYVWMLGKVNFR